MGGATAGDGEVTAEEKEGGREVPQLFSRGQWRRQGGKVGSFPHMGGRPKIM